LTTNSCFATINISNGGSLTPIAGAKIKELHKLTAGSNVLAFLIFTSFDSLQRRCDAG
jgi:hypothetical protein